MHCIISPCASSNRTSQFQCYLMECHPHSPTSHSVVDYGPIYLEEVSTGYFFKSVDNRIFGCLAHNCTMKFWHCWNLSTIIPSVWETLPLIVLEILSTESTISWPLSLAAPWLSYRNELRHLPYMKYAISILGSLLGDTK